MNNAYVTLLSSDNYIIPTVILAKSIRAHCTYPLVVAVTNNVSENIKQELKRNNIPYYDVDFIEYNKQFQEQHKDSYLLNIASKFSIFKLKEYDKLVYLDADSFVLQNIDDLFDYPDTAMLRDSGRERGFCAMFVFCPKNHTEDYYITLEQQYPVMECDIIEKLWKPSFQHPDFQIPHLYFYNITTENIETIQDINNFKAVHFCYLYKPWKYESVHQYFIDFAQIRGFSGLRYMLIEEYFNQYLIPYREELISLNLSFIS